MMSVVEMRVCFFLLQLKSRWKWPWRLKITTTLKSWRISHRHNTRQSRKTLPRRYDLFSSFHLSIPSLPIPFCFLLGYSHFAFLSNPSSLLFLLPLFSLPPSSNFLLPLSFPSHLTISLLLPSLSPMYALPPFLLFFSSFPFLRPPSFPVPTLYHFSHPLPLFSPSSFPPLSLDSYLSPHCLFVPIIPPNDLPTLFLPISHLVNRFNAFNARV